MSAFDALLREALVVAAILCMPVLAVAMIVGTAIAVAQAATQIQEQTIALLPKLLAVGLVLVLLGPLGLRLCERLFSDVIAAIPALVGP